MSDFYEITSKSHFNAYGYLYYNTFDKSNTRLNLIMEDDNGDENQQFKMNIFLQSSTSYVLVVTSFYPYITGNFSIIAVGPSKINFTQITTTY